MKPGRFLTAAMIVFALVVVPSAAYVGGYYGLPVSSVGVLEDGNLVVVRYYSQRWQVDTFRPAGRADAWLTGRIVHVVWFGEDSYDETFYQ